MGRIEESFDRLLATIKRTSGEDRDKARKHLVSLFEIFPPRDPRVSSARVGAVQLAVLAAGCYAPARGGQPDPASCSSAGSAASSAAMLVWPGAS